MNPIKTILRIAVITCICSFAHAVFAQAPSPSPTPFDALGLSANPFVTNTNSALIRSEAKSKILNATKNGFQSLQKSYTAMLAAFSDDSANGGLTTTQKVALLTPAQQVELITNGWLEANILNGIKPGTVPNPSFTVSGTSVLSGTASTSGTTTVSGTGN